MKTGSPPTAPNARAGLLTPPGISDLARVKAAWLFCRSNWEDIANIGWEVKIGELIFVVARGRGLPLVELTACLLDDRSGPRLILELCDECLA